MKRNGKMDQDPTQSLCWNCKFGFVVHRQEASTVSHPNVQNVPPESWKTDDPTQEEHEVIQTGILGLCLWYATKNKMSGEPISVGTVSKCNKFEPDNK